MRNELVERWVEQTDIYMEAVHCLEDAIEVSLLVWQKLCESFLTTFYRVCENHFTHCYNLLVIEEHVLCTCKSDTLCTECTSYFCILRSISVCTNLHLGVLIAKVHEFLEVTRQFCSLCLNLTFIYLTCSTIKR